MNDAAFARTIAAMGTFVTVQIVVGRDGTPAAEAEAGAAIERAFGWFRQIEATCTRFDPDSELMRLARNHGAAVVVSPTLYHAIEFAMAVARDTAGAFDPTVGHALERLGFNREHRTGQTVTTAIDGDGQVSYRDVELDPDRRTVTVHRPLVLDLGAVAKGLAVDVAAKELSPFKDFAIDAGGDLYLGGCNADGGPWRIGIRHPRVEDRLLGTLRVSDQAVCTSGDYERRTAEPGRHHILDPRTGGSASAVASTTVVAPSAMVADALGTAAFVLGPQEGLRLFERHGVEGLIVSAALQEYATEGLTRDYRFSRETGGASAGGRPVLSHS